MSSHKPPTHMADKTDPLVMQFEQSTQRLFWSWVVVLWVTLLGLLLMTIAFLQRQTEHTIKPELRITTAEVARGLKNELDRAFLLGIPLDKLEGVSLWFEDALKAQPVLKGIAIVNAKGQVFHHVGWHQDAWKKWAALTWTRHQELEAVQQGPVGEVASVVALQTPDALSVSAYLVVTGDIPPIANTFWLAWVAVFVVTGMLATAWLRYRIWREVTQPLYAMDAHFSALAQQRLSILPWTHGHGGVLHHIHHHWAGQLYLTQSRWQGLLHKLVEVKAAHFDLPVLQRLDELAATASTWMFQSEKLEKINASEKENNKTVAIKKWAIFSPTQFWKQKSLSAQLLIGMTFGVCCLAGLTWIWQQQQQSQQIKYVLKQQESVVHLSWQTILNSQRLFLTDTIDAWLDTESNRHLWIDMLTSAHSDESFNLLASSGIATTENSREIKNAHQIERMQEILEAAHAHLSVLDARGTLLATTARKPVRPYPNPALIGMQSLNYVQYFQQNNNQSDKQNNQKKNAGIPMFGVWQGQDRDFQLGTIQRLEDEEGTWVLAWSRSVDVGLDLLAKKLNAPVALADLRGQVIGADPHELVASWRTHQRQSHRTALGGNDAPLFHVIAVPLMSLSGHTIATLLVAFQAEPILWFEHNRSYFLVGLMALVLGLVYWGLWRMLRSLTQLGQRIVYLAQTQTPEKSFEREENASLSLLHLPSLLFATDELRQRINDFTVLRRSRERQGRRQARFIRHQMMTLAQRLNEEARQGVLEDLAQIENASKHQATHAAVGRARGHVGVEVVVDEISVLALGFQNLVHRVGDQYQQLAQLVQELREALRVKTQFIAIQQELEIARKMQLAILPQAFSQKGGFSIDARMVPAKEVGGDFYDFFHLNEHQVAIAIADVSGKGIPAAFFMAVSRTLLRAVAPFDPSPSVCLARLNNLLAADNSEMMFVTLFYAVLDTRTGRVQYGSAGHNPPYMVRQDATAPMEIPTLGNMALGVMEDMPYDQAEFVLNAGDRLFLYTDGVTEAMSPEQELYGEERLSSLLTELQHTPASEVPDLVLNVLHAFEGDGAQADDITTLVVHHAQQQKDVM